MMLEQFKFKKIISLYLVLASIYCLLLMMLNPNRPIIKTDKQTKLVTRFEKFFVAMPSHLDEYTKLSESEEYSYYDKYLALSKKILKGLGIVSYDNLVSVYSGGWRMRLSIAKALISNPEVLIMDEPTNHLDLEAVIWLSHYLAEYKNTLIITSHNVDFINQFSDTILYIGSPDFREPKLYTIRGNYDKLQQTLFDIGKMAVSAYNKLESEVAKMRSKSKPKAEIQEYITKANIPRPPKSYEVNIGFPEISRIQHSNVIRLNNVSFQYNPQREIFDNIDFSINLDSRFVIVGLNGVGKTTLFKMCMKQIEPDSGEILIDSRIRIGYYNQQVVESLPLNLTPIEYLQSLDHTLDLTKCRAILGRIGIKRIWWSKSTCLILCSSNP
jgi:ATPase subunit of ABC transporter with duplicated ATPase domains